jgi:hypothetical protein
MGHEDPIPRPAGADGTPHTRTREYPLAQRLKSGHIFGPMAGSLKRQRKLGVRDGDGSVIAFPYMPRVADLPRGWRHWSPAEKIEHLLGTSLDDMAEILSWPIAELDPFRLSVKLQVIRIVFAIGAKALFDGKLGREAEREHDRDRVLHELARDLRGKRP